MKKIILFGLFFANFYTFAQTKSIKTSPPLSVASPESQGFSIERLARLDLLLENAIKTDIIPGATTIICRNGKIIFQKAYGKADVPGNISMKNDNIFRIASMSKAVTATAVMMLWEQGKFNLDEPISKYIPEFKNPVVLDQFNAKDSTYTSTSAKSEITIRQLLTHTSGIGYGVIDGDVRIKAIYKKAGIVDLYSTENVKIGDNIKKLAKLPLHNNPGEKFVYSEGLDVLGYFIEIMSGLTFDEYLQKNIFQPLGMRDTYFYLPQDKISRLVKVQTKTDGKWTHFTDTFYDVEYPAKGARKFYSGGAGLSSTAKDYATFLQMYLNQGELNGKRLLSRTTVKTILADQQGELMGGAKAESGYGLAFGVLKDPGIARGGKGSVGAFEWGGYFNTSYFADPKEQIIGIIMKQTQRIEDPTSDVFKKMIYTALDD
jgi:CubicO group peptidase (beta-lactamase class C family)